MKTKLISSLLVLIFIFTFSFIGFADSHSHAYEYGDYDNATYRGVFLDSGEFQVNVQFTLEDNKFTNLSFRHLQYNDVDYLEEEEGTFAELAEQHKEALQYLEGKDVTATDDLYNPGEVVEEYEEVDGFTAATMRANKIISAIRDGLNRGKYRD